MRGWIVAGLLAFLLLWTCVSRFVGHTTYEETSRVEPFAGMVGTERVLNKDCKYGHYEWVSDSPALEKIRDWEANSGKDVDGQDLIRVPKGTKVKIERTFLVTTHLLIGPYPYLFTAEVSYMDGNDNRKVAAIPIEHLDEVKPGAAQLP